MTNYNPNTTSSTSQKAQILSRLQAGDRLTGMDGFIMFQSMALRNRVSELIREGYDIKKEWITTETTNKRVMCYYMTATDKA